MNGPLVIFRQPLTLFLPANFSIPLTSHPRFWHHRCPNHSSSRRYFSLLLSPTLPAEGRSEDGEWRRDRWHSSYTINPTASTGRPQRTPWGGQHGGPVNRQSLNWYWYTEAVKNVIKPPTPADFFTSFRSSSLHQHRTFRRKLSAKFVRSSALADATMDFASRFYET